ncbi:glycoside hydrolase family 3 C-terminal domain-containing protein [Aquibacillus koreensis]|uniref:Glycoside hydrolase family 3 C-terminal domain-containing protein n=1 Tax=Aquibacillus koreensis TaxID=279446 RepID=A0A9X3WMI8_9BACI|nr:glycoside hydrolase family 3 N-terminal domain-containing protein [Aquibacillus koreensis]MCT2536731.1 glycoside hydrolase family 3 C-terminal domain-containing protein [Aquibacillus koreensis]MDC3421513.1 glycoside hydrolase family 3 C-terminal domain-containing protein [Aquibacillus koreensis]
MFEYFKNRKSKKHEIMQRVKEDKAKRKERKQEIAALPESERKAEIKNDKLLRKEQKQQRKKELKSLSRKERKVAKKEAKIYKKLKNRPRRFTGWSIVAILLLTIGVTVGPTVLSLVENITGKHIAIDTTSDEAAEARDAADIVSEEIANEGLVLLKNENNALPLTDKKINVFGSTAFNFKYGGGGSGASDQTRAVNLFDALTNAGIEYNQELYDYYVGLPELEATTGNSSTGVVQVIKGMLSGDEAAGEPDVTDAALTQAKEYSENAMIIIQSDAVEASDVSKDQLKLSEEMHHLVEEVAENFSNVTIIVNAGNTLELGFVEEFPSIQSVLWIGTPGPFGTNSLAKALSGELNPSGRITDTYVYDIESSPASENFGDYQYENLDKAYLNYEEGIYVGYRFYETFYQGNEEGYNQAVQFPFGSGLSYTTFDWNVVNQELNSDSIELQVEVTNTGDVAGKDVVQVYYSAPYTPGGIEKSAINLATFEKTKSLEPGEYDVVTIQYDTRDMASYDMTNENYILENGTYEIKLGKNVHEIDSTLNFELAEDIVYQTDGDTGTTYKNRFTQSENEMTVLSRNDWEGTYPSDQDDTKVATDKVIERVQGHAYNDDVEMPATGADNGLNLEDLKGLDYDDPMWDDFLDQLTVDQMIDYVSEGAYHTKAIDEIGIPNTVLMDGPAGFSFFFKQFEAGAYPTEIVMASTWNKDLAYEMGEVIGQEAKAYGIHGWYAPALNIHRTPQGGRNFEYMSEDPVLNGMIGAGMSKGATDQGITVFIKHFAMNEQETNARSGILVWSNEQAMREIHLRPFEMTVKEADVTGAMSSFSYIDGKWANPELLNGMLRDEWGFEGVVSSDAVFGFMEAPQAVTSGNDLMLDIFSVPSNKNKLEAAYEQHPEAITVGLRNSMHNALYATLKTHIFNK